MRYNEFDPIIIDDPEALEVIAEAEAILKFELQGKPERLLRAAGRLGIEACSHIGILGYAIPGYSSYYRYK
jgi:hypothetical protein